MVLLREDLQQHDCHAVWAVGRFGGSFDVLPGSGCLLCFFSDVSSTLVVFHFFLLSYRINISLREQDGLTRWIAQIPYPVEPQLGVFSLLQQTGLSWNIGFDVGSRHPHHLLWISMQPHPEMDILGNGMVNRWFCFSEHVGLTTTRTTYNLWLTDY